SISNRQNAAQWELSGSPSLEQAANARWKQILEEYVAPDFPNDIDRDLQKYISK
ncbi:MAG: trimethylamine methyltransferase family protein, partial [Firmicutes bacterium]|nr:trimethylamine methyltransferase family protein [Bacillota bacterium]